MLHFLAYDYSLVFGKRLELFRSPILLFRADVYSFPVYRYRLTHFDNVLGVVGKERLLLVNHSLLTRVQLAMKLGSSLNLLDV